MEPWEFSDYLLLMITQAVGTLVLWVIWDIILNSEPRPVCFLGSESRWTAIAWVLTGMLHIFLFVYGANILSTRYMAEWGVVYQWFALVVYGWILWEVLVLLLWLNSDRKYPNSIKCTTALRIKKIISIMLPAFIVPKINTPGTPDPLSWKLTLQPNDEEKIDSVLDDLRTLLQNNGPNTKWTRQLTEVGDHAAANYFDSFYKFQWFEFIGDIFRILQNQPGIYEPNTMVQIPLPRVSGYKLKAPVNMNAQTIQDLYTYGTINWDEGRALYILQLYFALVEMFSENTRTPPDEEYMETHDVLSYGDYWLRFMITDASSIYIGFGKKGENAPILSKEFDIKTLQNMRDSNLGVFDFLGDDRYANLRPYYDPAIHNIRYRR